MNLRARLFVSAVITGGGSVLALELLRHPTWPAILKFMFYLLAACFASRLKVVLPGINGTMSVNVVVILVCIVELPLPQALVVGCVAAVVETTWQRKHVGPLYVAFDAAQVVIAIELCYRFFQYSARWAGSNLALRLMAAALIYFLANAVPAAAIVSLTENRVFRKTLNDSYFWSFPYCLMGAAIAWLVTRSNAGMGWQTSLLLVPVMYVSYRSYRLYLGKLEEEKKQVERVAELHLRTIEALALAIDAKDHTTHAHLKRVRICAESIGQEMGLSGVELEALRAAALLHDIGKLAVPEHIINKPGKLTPEEFEKIKIHPIVGAEILERVHFPYPVAPIVRAHHEWWDGTGYPDGLKGEEIPIGARILAAVDCLDAFGSERPYRRGVDMQESVAEIVRQSGKHFDPEVVEVLQRRYKDWALDAQSGAAERQKVSSGTLLAKTTASERAPEKSAASRELDFLASIVAARYEAQALLEFSNDLGRSLRLDETLSVVVARVRKLVPYDAIAVYRLRENKLVSEFATGDDYRAFSTLRIPLGEGVSGWVAQNRKPILNGNPALEPGYLDNPLRIERMGSALAVPLVGGDHSLLGVLSLYKMDTDAFSNDDLRILLAISEKIGSSIANAATYQDAADSAITDYLTGLPNARSLFLQLDAEISRCQRERGNLAVIICDLDGFKQVNDQLGHMTGNQLLRTFARTLKLACREYDYISRMGGDEFVILAPGLRATDVNNVYDRIRAAAAVSAEEVCPRLELSASVGIAFYPKDSHHAAQLLVEADKRMYEKKKEHRNGGPMLTFPVHTILSPLPEAQ